MEQENPDGQEESQHAMTAAAPTRSFAELIHRTRHQAGAALAAARPWQFALFFLAAAVILHMPLLGYDLLYAHDGGFHRMNASLFSANQSLGAPWPRWLPEAQNGYGSPIFLYYSPLLYAVYALLERISFGLVPEHGLMALTLMLFSGGLGISTYMWCRDYLTRSGAVLAALVFMAAPYHLCINLAIRGALPEVAALTFMPLMFLGAKRLAEAPCARAGLAHVPLAALSYAGLVYTHLLSAYMIIPFVGIAVAGHVWIANENWRDRISRVVLAGGAFALGTALAAPLLLPVLTQLDLITPQWWWQNDFLAAEHFIPFAFLGWHGIFLTYMALISFVTLFLLAVIGELALLPFFSRRRLSREAVMWLGLCLFAALLVIAVPRILWHEASPFARAQFPYRYLTLLELLALFLGVCVLRDLGPRRALWTRMLTIRICVIGTGAVLGAWALIVYYNARDLEESRKVSLAAHWQSNEYLPAPITGDFETTGRVADRLLNTPPPPLLTLEGGSAELTRRSGSTLHIETHSPQAATLHIRQFAFPGWQAERLEGGEALTLSSSGENGTLAVDVPAGQTRFKLYRTPLQSESWGWVAAIIAAIIIGFSGKFGLLVPGRGMNAGRRAS